jgi:ABC-2 type transport system ATP-binding protein
MPGRLADQPAYAGFDCPLRERTEPVPPSPDRSAPLLESDALAAGYGDTAVCGSLTVRLDGGECLAFIGANGTGKSTLIRTLSGRQVPVAGSVRLNGSPVAEGSLAYRRAVAAVPDEDAFFPSLTAGEHLLMTARGHQVRDPDTAVGHELEFFALTERRHALPDELSSGQRRRLLLASAFIRPFSLMVLDEPEQRLDQGMRGRLAERIRERVDAGAAVLMATHDPGFLAAAADRCVLVGEETVELAPGQAAGMMSV